MTDLSKMTKKQLETLQSEVKFELDKFAEEERAKVHKQIKEKLKKVKPKYSRNCTIRFNAEMSVKNINRAINNGDYINKELKIKDFKVTGEGIAANKLKSTFKDFVMDFEESLTDAIFDEESALIEDLQEDIYDM